MGQTGTPAGVHDTKIATWAEVPYFRACLTAYIAVRWGMPASLPPNAAQQLASRLALPKPMRRGSLSERFVKCSKPGCPCATDPKARHGPYYSLTRAVKGRTQSRLVSPVQADMVRSQIEAGHEFREQVDQYWKICEQWADEQVEGRSSDTAEAVKKGGSKRASKPKSTKKSKP